MTEIIHGDCLDVLRGMTDNSVDLVFCSPPYEAARTYGIDFKLRGQDWVDWCVERYVECDRVCRGLVAWVVEGQTRQFCWSAGPALLMADLHRAGIKLRKPPIFHRVGIPGSGGPDWLRNDFEFVVCSTKGKLLWSDNTAMGHPPRWAPGGAMSHRITNGSRRNAIGGTGHASGAAGRKTNGEFKPHGKKWGEGGLLPETKNGDALQRYTRGKGRNPDGTIGSRPNPYDEPFLANPGNVIKCVVGGGVMGSKLAHENEAPFPEKLAEFFIRSFCPPEGIVLDPFSGSGTTGSVAIRTGRKFIGIDIRESQVVLTKRRLAEVQCQLTL